MKGREGICGVCGIPSTGVRPCPSQGAYVCGICDDGSRDAPNEKRLRELRDTEAAYRSASVMAEELRIKRNELVRDGLNAGWTHAQISEATGLTRGRVGQIAQATNR